MKVVFSFVSFLAVYCSNFSRCFINTQPYKKCLLSSMYLKNIVNIKHNEKKSDTSLSLYRSNHKSYFFSQRYYEQLLKKLNSKNETLQNKHIIEGDGTTIYLNETDNVTDIKSYKEKLERDKKIQSRLNMLRRQQKRQYDYQQQLESENIENQLFNSLRVIIQKVDNADGGDENENNPYNYNNNRNSNSNFNSNKKSKNFEIMTNYNITFKDVGGYDNVKDELRQCVDLLKNYKKYSEYNVRIPKGLILEGPPGTGKTLLAKSLAGEALCNFISVSGSDFQEKYVGVGSSRVKELFKLAKENTACIIFIDEIDALGRKRSGDGESSSSERDSTLNALLVELDGFKNNSGIFIVAATNRVDLLDTALVRPGRIDKKIYIGLPDSDTREAIINIHITGKPHDESIVVKDLVDITDGLSGAQIENLLNEAMLNALRNNNVRFTYDDFDLILNKMIAGWQPNDHKFTSNIIDHIAIHEMGHAIVGIMSKYHSKMSKVVINLSSPRTPGYTVFENPSSNIYVREALFEHLMILLAGRIAEEVFYGVSCTTGAVNDFEEANKLAEKMIVHYGMGKNVIYPCLSEKYKEQIDDEVINLINSAYSMSEMILKNSKDLILECSEILKRDKIIKMEQLETIINTKYPESLRDKETNE